jgi:hypothetical protein
MTAALSAGLLVFGQFILDCLSRQVFEHFLSMTCLLGLSGVSDGLGFDLDRRRFERGLGLVEDQFGLRKYLLARRSELSMPRQLELLLEPIVLSFQVLDASFGAYKLCLKLLSFDHQFCPSHM